MIKKNRSYLGAVKSIFFITAVSVIGYMTTQALFVDRESSEENQFVVGTLDMNVTGESSTVADTLTVTGVGAQNITNGGKKWIVHNVGTLPGELLFEVKNIQNLENDCNEPEALVDTTCGTPGVHEGELGQHITTSVSVESGSTTTPLFSSTLANSAEGSYLTLWKQHSEKVRIPPGESRTIQLSWATDQNTFENEVQSDSVTFETLFQLRQVIPDIAPNATP